MNKSFLTLFVMSLATSLSAESVATSPEVSPWAGWRGSARAASVDGALLLNPADLSEAWRAEVGTGQSSPIVGPAARGSKPMIFVHSRLEDRETAQAFDPSTGAEVWRQTFEESYEPYPGAVEYGKGPKSTPALDDGRLCTLSVSGIVSCFDAATGDLLWRQGYGERFPEPYPPFGTSMSPLFDAGRLVVHVGGHPAGALLALDPATGKELWSYYGEGPGYSSPIVLTLDGTRQIVAQAHRNIIGVEADTGKLLWQHPSVTPCDQNIVTPVVYRDTVIFSTVGDGTFALRPGRQEQGGWTVERVWHQPERPMYMSSPVVVGDSLVGFGRRQRGQFFILDAATGEDRWLGPGKQGRQAALIGSADRLLALKNSAELSVFEVGEDGLVPISSIRVAEGEIWTHPAPVSGGWLVKDDSTLRFLRYGSGTPPSSAR